MQTSDRHVAGEQERQNLIQQAMLQLQQRQIQESDVWADESQESYSEIQYQQPQLPQQVQQRSAAIVQRQRQPQIEQYAQPIQYVPVGQSGRDWTPFYVLSGLVGIICISGAIMVSAAANTANQPNQSIQQLAAANAVLSEAAAVPRINCGWISVGCGGTPQQQQPSAPVPAPAQSQPSAYTVQPSATPEQIQGWVNQLSQYPIEGLKSQPPLKKECIDNPGLAEAYQQITGVQGCLAL